MGWSRSLLLGLAVYLMAALWRRLREARSAKRVVGRLVGAQLERILEKCPAVDTPEYRPPLWATNRWANLAAFVVKSLILQKWLVFPLRQELIRCDDGGTIAIDWADDEATRQLPPDAPILIVLHTITGCGKESTYFLQQASSAGFRGCVFNRRGHGMPLTSPQFNVYGSVPDCSRQVDLVHRRYPDAWIGMAGVSMGSALAVNYLGQAADSTPVRAGAVLCPAYDLETAFKQLHERRPMMDKFVLRGLQANWLNPANGNLALLKTANPAAAEACQRAESLDEFIMSSVPFTGADNEIEFMAQNNPVKWCGSMARPTLVLNSNDDPISLPCTIREDLADEAPLAVLVRTEYGAHVSFTEGFLGGGNYMVRLTLEFFKAALELDREPCVK